MSAVSYAMSSPRFVIESKRKTKRGLVYEKQIFPKHCYGEGVTAPEKESRIVYSFDKMTLAKGQVLRIRAIRYARPLPEDRLHPDLL